MPNTRSSLASDVTIVRKKCDRDREISREDERDEKLGIALTADF